MTDEPAAHDADDAAPGWDAITGALERLYPGQQPKHHRSVIPWKLGGADPLDGISAWKRLEPVPHWHFVSYGLTELYTKESDDPEESGYGFELTFRLACGATDDDPPAWALSFLQNLARYVFESGNVFDDGHWMTANGPIALEHDTLICSMGFVVDPELPAIRTPNGGAAFLQVVGLTLEEERMAKQWQPRQLLEVLLPAMPLWVTDLSRGSLLERPEIRRQADEGSKRDGSSSGSLYTDILGWQVTKCLLKPPVTEIRMGARQVEELLTLLPLRLPFGHAFRVVSRECAMSFEPGSTDSVAEDDGTLLLQLTPATVQAVARTLQPRAGSYVVPGFEAVRWKIETTTIKDAQGQVIRTIG